MIESSRVLMLIIVAMGIGIVGGFILGNLIGFKDGYDEGAYQASRRRA